MNTKTDACLKGRVTLEKAISKTSELYYGKTTYLLLVSTLVNISHMNPLIYINRIRFGIMKMEYLRQSNEQIELTLIDTIIKLAK